MGIRMVCDMFELHGWDTVYLGAAVPTDAIIHALREHRPDLLALSVTMFPYVALCREIIETIRGEAQLDSVTIAVGGRALSVASSLPKRWGVVTASDAAEFVKWAKDTFR